MAHTINSKCISCGACQGECPVSCITSDATKYNIDADRCIDCGACKSVCPVDAVESE